MQERGDAFGVFKRVVSELRFASDVRISNEGSLPIPLRTRRVVSMAPDGVVDRELEIAISQFAPGSETVKDKTIHTAMIVNFDMRRGGL